MDQDKFLSHWINELKGFGTSKIQLIKSSGFKKTPTANFLRDLRKNKKVFFRKRKWFLSKGFYKELKQKYVKHE